MHVRVRRCLKEWSKNRTVGGHSIATLNNFLGTPQVYPFPTKEFYEKNKRLIWQFEATNKKGRSNPSLSCIFSSFLTPFAILSTEPMFGWYVHVRLMMTLQYGR